MHIYILLSLINHSTKKASMCKKKCKLGFTPLAFQKEQTKPQDDSISVISALFFPHFSTFKNFHEDKKSIAESAT